MEIILLERIAKLGQMGDQVNVRPGYARNYLLPQGKALRATSQNRTLFESRRVQLEAQNLERKTDAQSIGDRLDGETFVIIRSAGETGQLYGSVAPRDVVAALESGGFTVLRQQVNLERPIKTIGIHAVDVLLHAEVSVRVNVNVARSDEEAERQARGESLTGPDIDEEEAGDADESDGAEMAGDDGEIDAADADSADDTDAATDDAAAEGEPGADRAAG